MRVVRMVGHPGRIRGAVLSIILLAAVAVPAADPLVAPLHPDPSRLAAAPKELQVRLREDPFIYFRFVNPEWSARVCTAFRNDLQSLPSAILHGDAHVGQYAVTATERGLDDFDDAARGPSVVDIVRFLGSVDLIARRRGWTADRERLFQSFFDGYARALTNPAYLPPDPEVVKRVRARPTRTQDEFFAWCESLMQPLKPELLANTGHSLELLESLVRAVRPELPAGYLRPKKSGYFQMGVGSALTRKFLTRVEGPTVSPEDDLILEAKELRQLRDVPCLQIPISGEVFRVITAAEQIGRIRHEILLVVPRREDQTPDAPPWWIRSWDRTYKEVTLADLASADELAELAHDAGVQLGAANLRGSIPILEQEQRRKELTAVRHLAPRIRATAHRLTDALLAGWAEMRSLSPGETANRLPQ